MGAGEYYAVSNNFTEGKKCLLYGQFDYKGGHPPELTVSICKKYYQVFFFFHKMINSPKNYNIKTRITNSWP